MTKRGLFICMAAVVLLMMIALPMLSLAQDENSAPLYVRYCVTTRQIQGEDELVEAITGVEARLAELEDLLERVETGNLTFLEGITQAETNIAEWEANPVETIPCLSPLNADMRALNYEILIAMLYGQQLNNTDYQDHLVEANGLLERVRQESGEAKAHLSIPLPPTATPLPDTPPTATPEGPTPTPEPRTAEQLTTILQDYLLQNGVTVLSQAEVQLFPDNALITLQLNRFVLDGADLDYENSLFTLDAMAGLLSEWPEAETLSAIRIETIDQGVITLVLEVDGESFRAHYFDSTLNRDAFTNSFVVIEGQ